MKRGLQSLIFSLLITSCMHNPNQDFSGSDKLEKKICKADSGINYQSTCLFTTVYKAKF